MAIQDLLLLTLLNTGICIGLPKMVSVFESIKTRQLQLLSAAPTVKEQPQLSQTDAFPELASLAR
jgi:hypothetical protein